MFSYGGMLEMLKNTLPEINVAPETIGGFGDDSFFLG